VRWEGEKKEYQRVKRLNVCSIYSYEDSEMKPTKNCLKNGGVRHRKWKYNGGG
jgi:hypothetical protein